MKIKYLLFALVFGAIVACDPQVDDKDLKVTTITKLELGSIEQYSMAEDSTYYKDQYGKYIKYDFSGVPSVVAYYLDDEDDETILDYGKSGGMFMFRIATEVVELTTQTLFFRYVDVYGEEYTCSTTLTFYTTPLSIAEKYFSGMTGKAWRWDTDSPVKDNDGNSYCWGNGGNDPSDFEARYNGSFFWWGVTSTGDPDDPDTDGFASQQQHMNPADTFENSGGDVDSTYMAVSLSGSITCYKGIGDLSVDKQIRSGSYSITGYDETGEDYDYMYQGVLETSAGAILWPYAINQDGYEPTIFEIVKLTDDNLMLIYPSGDDGDISPDAAWTWNWAEVTFWYFRYDPTIDVNIETPEESLQAKKGWTWAMDGNNCWGNGGYGGGDSDAYAAGGKWWGCETSDFADQFGDPTSKNPVLSAEELYNEGEGAYMTFDKSGNLLKFNPDGEQVGKGKYTVDWDKKTDKGGFGTKTYGLMTIPSGDNILHPYIINGQGMEPEWFDIAYIDSDFLILINQQDDYFPANWTEYTFWRFEKRK